ncbi:encapsulin [Streptomyces sp. NPDC051664]|uniref:encapsulin n=1 Tax=Streptomyces sp. NPDC051664 TaxID=3365668 RepID=UPI0037A49A0E
MLDGSPLRAPALSGGSVLSTRGGDFGLLLGQDMAIGCTGHGASGVELYFHEMLTYTDEAMVVLEASDPSQSCRGSHC